MASKTQPWINDKWIVSQHNYAEDVVSQFSIPSEVKIYDVTLRDGEQHPGVVLTKEDKVKIAQKLDEVGIHKLEAGMPAVSKEDFNAVKAIASLGLKAKPIAFCRARKDDIDTALKADVEGVLIEFPSSDILLNKGFNWDREKVLDKGIEAISYAKEHGLHVTFFPYDTTRADVDFLKRIITTITEQTKPDGVAVVDTFGVASPQAFAYLVRLVKSWVNIPIECHCHNDMGLATANALAAVTAGAEVVQTNINGIGERSGGAATEEVAVALRILYGVDMGLNYSKLCELSQLVQQVSGVKVAENKPVVGQNSFCYEAGIAVMFCHRFAKENFLQGGLPYLPEFVGNKFRLVLGKKSGRHSIEWKLEEMGLNVSEEKIDEILQKVKDKSISLKRAITDQELRDIIKDLAGI